MSTQTASPDATDTPFSSAIWCERRWRVTCCGHHRHVDANEEGAMNDIASRYAIVTASIRTGRIDGSQAALIRKEGAMSQLASVVDATTVRPFQVNVPDADLSELRRRVKATRLPERETVSDFSQGVPLDTVEKLARYWATEYDWRKVEARLNSVPNFITEIDGLDIHFIHVRSKHENALPVVITHGWPGSIVEQLKLIEPLTNPTAHGGTAADAFHVVIPSIPG